MTNAQDLPAGSQFETNLLQAAMEYSMLKHPFYIAWTEGKLSKSILAEYAKQYYAHVRAFPTYVSAVHSRCDDLAARQVLLENLIEEERGPENHPELWLRFAESLGVARGAVQNAELLPATSRSVARLKSLTQSEDYLEALAALYAYESQIPDGARTKRIVLKEFYGITGERAVAFFRVHEGIDVLHQQIEKEILKQHCQSATDQSRAVAAAKHAARALWEFLDGVTAAYLTVKP
jgi:pyrroloquinoline-quinone synthase